MKQYKKKLYRLLQSFSSEEWKEMDIYLKSPALNTNDKAYQLFKILTKYKNNFEQFEANKQTHFKQLFPEKLAYKDANMRVLTSSLTKLIEDFLAFNQYKNDAFYRKQKTLQSLLEKRLDKDYYQLLNKVQRIYQDQREQSVDDYLHKYFLEESIYQFNILSKEHPVKTSLQKVVDYLDTYFLANKLRYCCAILTRQNIHSVQHEIAMFNELLALLEENQFSDIPLIQYYYKFLLLLIEEEKEENFFELKALLLSDKKKVLTQDDKRYLFTGGINYCSRKIKGGKANFYQHLFDLYREMLDTDILMVGRYIKPAHYNNLVYTALRLKKFDWTKQFIMDNKALLPPNIKESTYHYNLANYYFSTGNYHKSIQNLLLVQFDNIYSHIQSKKLLLQAYYELNESEALFSLVGNFRDLVRRKAQISERNRQAYRNFIHFTVTLYRIKESRGRRKITQKLIKEINAEQVVIDKVWLEDKLKEFSFTQIA